MSCCVFGKLRLSRKIIGVVAGVAIAAASVVATKALRTLKHKGNAKPRTQSPTPAPKTQTQVTPNTPHSGQKRSGLSMRRRQWFDGPSPLQRGRIGEVKRR